MRTRWWLPPLLAVLAVVGVGWFLLRDTSTPVGLDAVRERFDGVAGTAPGDPGIYRYATTGFEAIDALQGARHDYPEETYLTLSASACGPLARWDALAERWIEWSHCGDELAVDATTSYHEWFGIPDLEEEVCAEPRPISGLRDDEFETACVAGPVTERYDTAVVGSQILTVGEEQVLTTHIRRTSTLEGTSTGLAEVDVWRLVETALIVRMEVERTSVSPSAAGDVTYTEVVIIDLMDLEPIG